MEKKSRLTIEELRSSPDLAHLTDEEAEEVSVQLQTFAELLFELYTQDQTLKKRLKEQKNNEDENDE